VEGEETSLVGRFTPDREKAKGGRATGLGGERVREIVDWRKREKKEKEVPGFSQQRSEKRALVSTKKKRDESEDRRTRGTYILQADKSPGLEGGDSSPQSSGKETVEEGMSFLIG